MQLVPILMELIHSKWRQLKGVENIHLSKQLSKQSALTIRYKAHHNALQQQKPETSAQKNVKICLLFTDFSFFLLNGFEWFFLCYFCLCLILNRQKSEKYLEHWGTRDKLQTVGVRAVILKTETRAKCSLNLCEMFYEEMEIKWMHRTKMKKTQGKAIKDG